VPSGVSQFDYGGLRFVASAGFQPSATGDLFANAGYVSIGYKPAAKENFKPLVEADLTRHDDSLLLLFNQTLPTQPRFNVEDARLDLVAVDGSPTVPIPIFSTNTAQAFDIHALTLSGDVTISPGDSLPFSFHKLSFSLSTLQFADPTPADTTNAQVKLQGTLAFKNVSLLSGVTADVTNTNYVIADHSGITITGATITNSFQFDSATIGGSITVGYDKSHDSFTFGGDVSVTINPQQRAVLIGAAAPAQTGSGGGAWQATVNVPVGGLYPLPYTVYAVVNDGFNAPVRTASSEPFTPAFAVQGNVSNQNGDALPGWSVFLDYDGDGKHESNEPIFKTSNPDGFYAFAPTFDPSTGWKAVPVNTPFNVRLIVPSSDYADPGPVTITYDGLTTKDVSFAVQQKTSIQGTVYNDLPLPTGKVPLALWTVFLDANGNGVLDPGEASTLTDSNGRYVFFNLPPNSTQTVRVQVQPGYYPTGPDSYAVAVGGNAFWVYDNNDFPVLPFSTISGKVLGPGASPLRGVTVSLTQGGQVVASTTSAADGSYSFDSVLPGTYAVAEPALLTWQPVAPVAVTVQTTQNPSGVNLVNVRVPDGLVPGGGFEAPPVGPGAYKYSATDSPWVFYRGAGVSGNDSGFTDGNPPAPEGSQVAFLQGNGIISQAVNFAAGTYTLSFLAAQRGDVYQDSSQTFAVEIDGTVVGPTFTPPDSTYRPFTTVNFTVTDGYHTVSFVGLNPNGGDNTAFIDAVSLQLFPGVYDGGFEAPPVGPKAYQYNPSGSAWAFSGDTGVSGNGSQITLLNPPAPEGSQVAFLQGNGTFSQVVNLAAGTYALSFLAAQRGFPAPQGGGPSLIRIQSFTVEIDGSAVGTFTPAGTSYSPCTTASFTVTAGLHTIRFVGLDPYGTDSTAFIDFVHFDVADGGFEAPPMSGGLGAYAYSPAKSPWTFVSQTIPGNGAGVAANGSEFTLTNPPAPEGSQVAFVQAYGTISQTITFAAGTYALTFFAAQRANVPSRQSFDVQIDGNVVGHSIAPAGTSYSPYSTASFTVTAGPHTISFVGLDLYGGDNTVFIDAVSVQLPQGLDRTLTIPDDVGAGDWTVRRDGDNLDVMDRAAGLVESEPLGALRSLTVVGAHGRPASLTLDPTRGRLDLPGGIRFVGRASADDALRVVLGGRNTVVSVADTTLTINNMVRASWSTLGGLTVVGGAGDDTFRVRGTPLTHGTITLQGGAGANTYALATKNSALGVVTVSGRDTLDFSGASAGVTVDLGRDRGQVQHIGGGHNTLAIEGSIANLTGSAYGDVLTGDAAGNVIRGLGGNDVLSAGAGDSVLVGGAGNDVLIAGRGRDLLIGGGTVYDANDAALHALLAEWSSDRPLRTRVANLTDGGGSRQRLNGNCFFNATTLIDEGATDLLFGNSRVDWFLPLGRDGGVVGRRR
jgi:hypothetical protein